MEVVQEKMDKIKTEDERREADKKFLGGLVMSYAAGFCFGSVGRGIGKEWLPIAPIVIYASGDATFQKFRESEGVELVFSGKKLICYAAYAAGIATANIDRIYRVVGSLSDKL